MAPLPAAAPLLLLTPTPDQTARERCRRDRADRCLPAGCRGSTGNQTRAASSTEIKTPTGNLLLHPARPGARHLNATRVAKMRAVAKAWGAASPVAGAAAPWAP